MIVGRLRVNHIERPLGYAMGNPTFTWEVSEAIGKRAVASRIVVIAYGAVVADTGWADLDSACAHVGGLVLLPRTRYAWYVGVISDAGERARSEPSWFETGKMGEPWRARWVTCDSADPRHPIFVTTLRLVRDKAIASARLYVLGLGIFYAYIDGVQAGDEYLAPGTHAYDQWLQVATLDVSTLVHDGARLEVRLGNGWWKGRFGYARLGSGCYSDDWRLIAELRVVYEDGSEQVIGTGTDWQVVRSNVTASSIYGGERIDDTLPATPPVSATLVGRGEARACLARLSDRLSLPIRAHETFVATLLRTPAGEDVFDLGQNIAGTFRLRVHEPSGTVVRVQTGEVLQDGNFYRGNLRLARAELVYVSDGLPHEIEPRFTYYGYRYAKVEGVTNLREGDFTGVALYSDFDEAGSLTTGHELVNRLVSNTVWSMRSNFMDTPTDCPQRDERLGWTGDANVFSMTALYLADHYPFYRKYLHDMATEQRVRGGAVPMVVPAAQLKAPANAVWGDACTFIPWNMYLMSGDASVLVEHFEAMCAWVDYVERVDGDDHGWRDAFQFGDWLALDGPEGGRFGGTDEGYIAYLFFWRSATIVADVAAVLGKGRVERRYRALSQKISNWIGREYFSATGRCVVDTQTAYALALAFGFGDAASNAQALLGLLAANDGKLSTGFVGTTLLNQALSMAGHTREGFDLLLNEDFPGWLHCVTLGATTIWERWDALDDAGYVVDGATSSLNHYSLGAIVGWLYAYVAGLRPQVNVPGLRRATVAPTPDWRLRSVDCTHHASVGIWRVAWECIDERHVRIRVTVPFGCMADVVLPHATEAAYRALGGHVLGAGSYEVTYETCEPLRQMPSGKATEGDVRRASCQHLTARPC